MRIKGLICFFAGLTLIFMSAFCRKPIDFSEIKHYPLDNLEGVITRSDVRIDKEITSDGNGSLCITTIEPATVRLYETGDIDIENSRLIYQARVRTEGVEGQVYIEMLCHFPGKGEFFSRAIQSPLSGSQGWTKQETPFLLKKGENPDNVKINLVVEGKGKVWIDDIRLLKCKL
ncbi:MAG TPA: hypothetical protein PK874_08305 [Desulfobacteraceae bacterium]|nr:hypothetical protein [Desulfobacteraceae bacterium]HPJ68546.1 hypothetical protein [Desulfobacteraceae bacterium]HPQ28696.1 hypothetical protein [Desulfobacteraceae bacterium]